MDQAVDKQWFGHPRGLATLFFTEMWERFSYYGMRAMLVLFMTAVAVGENPGLGFETSKAGAIYGMYTACAYLLTLPGGWIADRLIGARRAVLVGGAIIAAGNFLLAVPSTATFYLGLAGVAIGTGLLKPNVSTMVGTLYPGGGARRDAGFSIFYMGINLGAFLGPIICGYLGQNINWHYGFVASGVGMICGLIQYSITGKHLGAAGLVSSEPTAIAQRSSSWKFFAGAIVAAGIAIFAISQAVKNGSLVVTPEQLANALGYVILGIFVLYFGYVFVFGKLQGDEWKGVAMIAVLFLAVAIFWSGFEQAGSSMNLFADRLTDRMIGGWEVPSTWLQSVNAIFIILLAPVFAILWQKLGSRDLSMPMKFAVGLVVLGAGFAVMMWAAAQTNGDQTKVGMSWLVAAYFLHTCGELCVSPVGLSSVTKLSPERFVGQMMGIWFMGAAFGNLIAGIVGGSFGTVTTYELFRSVTHFTIAVGVVMAILTLIVFARWTRDALGYRGMH